MSDDEIKTAYPLTWPDGQPVTPASERDWGAFKATSVDRGRRSIQHAIAQLGGSGIVISTNLPLRLDGEPRGDAKVSANASPGVAVYFNRETRPYVFACDAFTSIGANLRAIYLTIEALRAIQRYGASNMLERAFTGFAALPPAGEGGRRHWTEVLGVASNASPVDIREVFRALARRYHPDNPDITDDGAQYALITRAFEEAQKEKGFQ